MTDQKVVLITGVSGYWGSRFAAQLVLNEELHVIGIDLKRPKQEIKGLDFIQADIRNPLLCELFESEKVDTVCHLAFQDSLQPNESAFEKNVIGAMKVFGACCQAGVRKIVLKSSTEVYGAIPTNSAFLREEHPLKANHNHGYLRDLAEIEAFCNGFRLQAPEVLLTVLRFPSIVGPTADTPMTRFLKEPLLPVLLGFDPMMQVIHEDDVVAALLHAVVQDAPGVFNIAAEGVLPLRKVLGLAGKIAIPVFHLFAYWGKSLAGSTGMQPMPFDLDSIRYPWVGDLTRMREELMFVPQYTAEEALREFAGHQRMSVYKPETTNLVSDEERLRDTIDRRRRVREQSLEGSDPASSLDETEMEGIYDE